MFQKESSSFKSGHIVLMFIVLVSIFLLIGVLQNYNKPHIDFDLSLGDDWLRYHENAVNVLEEGLHMPDAPVPYRAPAGFLYIYFVAFLYAIFGINPTYVYVFQSAMLGASVGLLYLSFRRNLGRIAQIVLFISLFAFACLDIQRHYTGRLLSENLFIFELAIFFYLFFKGYIDNKKWMRIASIGFLGILYLTRPNVVFFLLVLCVWLLIFHHKNRSRGYGLKELITGMLIIIAIINLMALRNYAVTKQWILVPYKLKYFKTSSAHPETWIQNPKNEFKIISKRALFSTGFLNSYEKTYNNRPHWILMWLMYVSVICIRFFHRQKFPFQEKILHFYVFTMLSTSIFLLDIANYGFRFLVYITLPALGGAVPIIEFLKKKAIHD